MTIIDNDLILATTEAAPGNGAAPGALGGTSITGGANSPLAIDLERTNETQPGVGVDTLGTADLDFIVDITTGFGLDETTLVSFDLVSYGVSPALLDNPAAGNGKVATVGTTQAITASAALDGFVLTHSMGTGTPVVFTALTGGTGLSTNTIYWVIPTSPTTFQLATSLANAHAGTAINFTTNVTAATMVLYPVVHATTGLLYGFELEAGSRFFGRSLQGKGVGSSILAPQAGPLGGVPRPASAMIPPSTSTGGGAGTGVQLGTSRYLSPRVWVDGTSAGTTGRFSMAIARDAGENPFKFHPPGMEAL